MNESDVGIHGEDTLTQARDAYRQQWVVFGGPDGTAVTFGDIENLLGAHLTVIKLEQQLLPASRTMVANIMSTNPLVELDQQHINLRNPAVTQYAIWWLRNQRNLLEWLKKVGQIEASAVEIFNRTDRSMFEDMKDIGIGRKITACTTAIKLMQTNLKGKEG